MTTPGLQGPQYPLSREEFRRALTTGHGRVKLHVERFGAVEFRDEILAAATNCKMYDLECEGPRADWLADLCLAAGIEREVVALSPPEHPDDRNQRTALLLELAKRGVPGAREALYACWGRRYYSGFYATDEILELDGDAGLLFVARAIGREIQKDAEISAGTDELWKYDEARSKGAANALLASLADGDAEVRAYLDSVQLELANWERVASRPQRPRTPIAEVLKAIRGASEQQESIWAPARGRTATREELQQVLGLLLELDAPRPMHHALWCLGMSTMAPLHPRIFELTRHEDEQVRYWAGRVLSKHSLPGVRAFGLEALARRDLVVALEILMRSAQIDDVETLVAALRPLDDPDEEHGVGSGILDLFKHSPEVRDARLALHVYERTPCMQCREDSLEHLLRLRACPQWVLDECAFDGSDSIRVLAARESQPPDLPAAVS